MTTVTYPPELLPSPAKGDEAEVVVIHPDTKKATTVAVLSGELAPNARRLVHDMFGVGCAVNASSDT